MATASRANSGAYDTLYANVVEHWLNTNNAEDLVFLQTPTLAFLNAAKETRPLPHDITVRILESRGTGVDSYEYYDTVSTQPTKGAQAARFEVANYSAPLALSDQEELEFTSPEAIADHIDLVMQKQLNEMTERLAKDVFRGNVSNAKNITGLEQLLPGYNHLDSAGSAANSDADPIIKRFQGKQAANAYGGITRSGWADDDTPGTHWEGNVYQHFGTPFGLASGLPNAPMTRLEEAIAMASYGASAPNLLVSGFKPYREYETATQGLQQINRQGGEMQGVNITWDNIKVKNATWFWDDFCKQYNTISAEDTSYDSIYGLNTDYLHFLVDSRRNFSITEPRTTTDQFAAVRHIQWRGQLICRNPRTQFRYFDYR